MFKRNNDDKKINYRKKEDVIKLKSLTNLIKKLPLYLN